MNDIKESKQWVGLIPDQPAPEIKQMADGRIRIRANLLFEHPAFFDKVDAEDFFDPLEEVVVGGQVYKQCWVDPGDRLFDWVGRYCAVRFRNSWLETGGPPPAYAGHPPTHD